MRQSATADELLETLEQAGVPLALARKAKVLDSSNADTKANQRVHTTTNTLIMDLLRKNELGNCVHVTGGARALTDPFHRQVCEAMLGEDKEPFRVLYYVPQERLNDPLEVVFWNLKQWRAKGFNNWRQQVLTIDMIGRRAVDMKGWENPGGIQYSVFGDRYAQIQGQHAHDAIAKPVWLLESENVNGILQEHATIALTQAIEIDESSFHDFVATLHSNIARAMLLAIGRNAGIDRDVLLSDHRFWISTTAPQDTLKVLCSMAFVKTDHSNGLHFTEAGQSFVQET
jgi:hypothetical protein